METRYFPIIASGQYFKVKIDVLTYKVIPQTSEMHTVSYAASNTTGQLIYGYSIILNDFHGNEYVFYTKSQEKAYAVFDSIKIADEEDITRRNVSPEEFTEYLSAQLLGDDKHTVTQGIKIPIINFLDLTYVDVK